MFQYINFDKKVILIGLGLGLLCSVTYLFLLKPQLESMKDINNRLNIKQAQLQKAEAVLAYREVELKRAEQVQKQLLDYSDFFGTEFRKGTALMLVSQKVADLDLKIINFEPRGIEDKEVYLQLPLKLELQGSYSSLLLMLSELEALPNLTEIRAIKLSPGSDSLDSSEVNAQCELVIYCDSFPEKELQLERERLLEWQTGREHPFSPPALSATHSDGPMFYGTLETKK